ncbi:MAG: hypothetical protein R3292_08725 [Alcanivorax sp.]|nr:hypothetical protein [Alcanivorax sp.]
MDAEMDNRWLMQYQIVSLVNQCRRLIRAEFDERLALSDPRLREKLAHYAGHTRSRGLQRLYAEIRLALIELEGPDELTDSQHGQRRYRGQRVNRGQTTTADTSRPRRVTLYRGRPVPSS